MKQFQVIFQPIGVRGKVSEGTTLLEASREMGVQIESLCGGLRDCGKCKVRVVEGRVSPFSQKEVKFITDKEKSEGYRLGCVAKIRGPVLIFIPEESRAGGQIIRKAASKKKIKINPGIELYSVQLHPPSPEDPLGDLDRLMKALFETYHLSSLEIDYPVLLKLSEVLRQGDWKVTVAVWMKREVLDLYPGKVEDVYGLAIDIGTTTVAGYLCHLIKGNVVSTESILNPQIAYGEDVMSRISYVMTHPEDGLKRMSRLIIEGLNQLIKIITKKCHLLPKDILELTVVGNTLMHHLFLKVTPHYLGISPFTPAINHSIHIKARDLGLEVNPSANVYLLPIEAGFVGADNVGVLLAETPYRQDKMVLIIDIGTNGELVLGNRKTLLSASCATGPALEGAHIKFGMRAAPEAIERVKIDPDTFEVDFKVIGNESWRSESKGVRARGICGSGIIDTVAELFKNGFIDRSGRLNTNIHSSRLKKEKGILEFVIARREESSIGRDISITQQDIRNVQLAKGALYAGSKIMMRKLGIKRLDKIVLAGAFGSFIDKENAMILGMFPDCNLKNVSAVGNAAGDGARIALLDRDKRTEAEEIARKVNYIELSIEKDFQEEFIEALQIPHMKDSFPHLRGSLKKDILTP